MPEGGLLRQPLQFISNGASPERLFEVLNRRRQPPELRLPALAPRLAVFSIDRNRIEFGKEKSATGIEPAPPGRSEALCIKLR